MIHMCRFCKQDHNRQRMFKYAARHWAHYDCWLEAKGKEIREPGVYHEILQLLELGMHGWQLEQFPVFKLADWLEAHNTQFPKKAGRSWVDKACWLIKGAIKHAEQDMAKV
jgi:hypothetical protein